MKTLHVVSHTHWDREWYLTFQEFRFRLVRLIDRLLDLLEQDPGYRFFTLDGQTIILDDYLEIRPEQEARIRQLVQEGRLLVGPWYVLPDEFLEGPEAMIRNLFFGRAGCRRIGGEPQPMEGIGYIPDTFGHISQLPQLAAGFGWQALCFWRGVGNAPTEFRWAAPDGTQSLVLHLRHGYGNGAELPGDETGFQRDLAAERDALVPHAATSHLLVMQGTDHMQPRPDLPALLRTAGEALGDAVVHSTLPAYLAAVQSELGAGGLDALPLRRGELRSPQRAHLLPAVLSARMWVKQSNARCETLLTRWAEPFGALAEQVAGTQALRGFVRTAWRWLLQNHPHDSICGCSVDQVHREMKARFAWSEQITEQVTQSSLEALAQHITTQDGPGDASPGSSDRILVFNPTAFPRTDRVRAWLPFTPQGLWRLVDGRGTPTPHRVLGHRSREPFQARMDREALTAWLGQIAEGQGPSLGRLIFQRLEARVKDGVAYLDATVGCRPPAGGVEQAQQDAMGRVVALLADPQIQQYRVRVVEDAGLEVEFLAQDVPSVGYDRFSVQENQGAASAASSQAEPPPDPTSRVMADAGATTADDIPSSMLNNEGHRIANEFFVVEANPADGALTVTDKQTGLVLAGVNRFVDGGDRGDEYTFCPPEQDVPVDSPAAPPAIHSGDDGLGPWLEIQSVYRVPRSLDEGERARRSTELVELPITSRVRLTPGVRRVEFETRVDNRAQDHRLRVHVPTPIVADRSWAESHFDVVERPIELPTGTEGWAEQPVSTHPQLTFVDVTDGQRGVLLANRGLPEYELLPGDGESPGVTLALTLLRCVGWLSRGDLHNRAGHAGPFVPTPEAQCPGEHTFHYALVPHPGNYLSAYREAHAFNAPLRAVCTDAHAGSLPPQASFLRVAPSAVVVSAVKPPEEGEGLIVRLYNSASVPLEAQLALWQPFQEAAVVPHDEGAPLRTLAREANRLSLLLRAKEIATLRFQFR